MSQFKYKSKCITQYNYTANVTLEQQNYLATVSAALW